MIGRALCRVLGHAWGPWIRNGTEHLVEHRACLRRGCTCFRMRRRGLGR